MRRALVGCLVLSVAGPPLGVFLVLRRMSLMSDVLQHGVLPGIAVGAMAAGLSIWAMGAGGVIAGILIAVITLAITALFGRTLLGLIEGAFEDVSTALLVSCLGIFFLPVTALSSFGPQCVQFLASRGTPPGKASGVVYGVSTLGNIAGVMLTAFVLIPHFHVSTLLYLWLGVAVASLAALVRLLRVPISAS
jgi:hypothetical protein